MSANDNTTPHVTPQVTVLLATHNGERWLSEQLDSIFAQVGVDLAVVALDDASTDSTVSLLKERALIEPRLTVLPSPGPSGSAAANFYRLITTVPVDKAGLIAFADQDDVWMPTKLARHSALLSEGERDGVSSDVTAFTANGDRSLVRKSYPQRQFDFLLESPGPGCSFLITPRLATLVRDRLNAEGGLAKRADFHDWLIYALCRGAGWAWHIDDVPSLDYRQHENNTMGANKGWRAANSRLALVSSRWHRDQAALLCEEALAVAPDRLRAELTAIQRDLTGRGIARRLSLLSHASQLRRRPRDRAIMRVLIALGMW
jgi:rhamnosyltransferase